MGLRLLNQFIEKVTIAMQLPNSGTILSVFVTKEIKISLFTGDFTTFYSSFIANLTISRHVESIE